MKELLFQEIIDLAMGAGLNTMYCARDVGSANMQEGSSQFDRFFTSLAKAPGALDVVNKYLA